jgi:hypothetical protein
MRKTIIGIICVFVLVLAVCSAQATSYTLAVGDAYYVGRIDPGIPAAPTEQDTYLETLLSMPVNTSQSITVGSKTNVYTRSSLTPIASYDDLIADNGQVVTGVGVTLPATSIFYVMVKYDGPNWGTEVWYTGNLNWNDTIIIQQSVSDSQKTYGISGYHTWSGPRTPPPPPVPEPATMLLLGLGLVGLSSLKRKIM